MAFALTLPRSPLLTLFASSPADALRLLSCCSDDKAEEVPIPGVTGAILELVVNYMREHKGKQPLYSHPLLPATCS